MAQRYDMVYDKGHAPLASMDANLEGDWVRYEEHANLELAYENLKAELINTERTMRSWKQIIKADNYTINNAINRLDELQTLNDKLQKQLQEAQQKILDLLAS